MHVRERFTDHRMFMFLYALMEVVASVPNIICIVSHVNSYTKVCWLIRGGFPSVTLRCSAIFLLVNTGCSC